MRRMRSGYQLQKAVILALFLREIRTRFGAYKLGYLWALLEPLAHLAIMLIVFSVILGRSNPLMSFPVFFTAGIVPWLLFNKIALSSLRAVDSNIGLLTYRPVRIIDTVLTRAFLEFCIHSSVYLVLLLIFYLVGEPIEIENIPLLTGTFILMAWFAFGLGLVLMVISDAYPEAEKIIPIVIHPLYFFSGIFYSVSHLPPSFRVFMLWNPVLHAIELGRHALAPSYDISEVSLSYLFVVALGLNTLGLLLYRAREKEMLNI